MDIYKNSLLILKELLKQSGDSKWENWINQDLQEWENFQSTKHHKSAFGGMGSINDFALGGLSAIGSWQNVLFDFIKGISWTFATYKKIDLHEYFKSNAQITITGWICRECEYSEISDSQLSYFLAETFLPDLIKELLPTERSIILTDLKSLSQKEEVQQTRENIIRALQQNKIHVIKDRAGWMRPCPNCASNETCVYRWNIVTSVNTYIIERSGNNLKLLKDNSNFRSSITSWFKRIFQ